MKLIIKQLKNNMLLLCIVLLAIFAGTIFDLSLPSQLSNIIDNGVIKQDIGYTYHAAIYMVIIVVLSAICGVIVSAISSIISSKVGTNLRSMTFKHIEELSLEEFNKLGVSSLITRTTNDVTQIQNFLIVFIRIVLTAPLMAIGGIILSLQRNFTVSINILIAIITLSILIFFVGRKAIPLTEQIQKKIDKINLLVKEKLTGIRVVRAFDNDVKESDKFDQANKDLTSTTLLMHRLISLVFPSLILIFNLTSVSVVWISAQQVNMGNMQVGDIMALVQYVAMIIFSFMMLTMIFIILPRATTSANRIQEILNIKSNIKNGTKKLEDKINIIEFKNVSFKFPDSNENILSNLNFVLNTNEITAMIGSTGSGKTTLSNLIMRLYDVTEGEILINNINIKEYDIESIRNRIGYVPQQVMVFSGSINENILVGNKLATESEILEAADISQSQQFIDAQSEKFNSNVNQGGTNLSGGQKQRLSMARALAKKRDAYIFDDSFSALDYKTDGQIRNTLKEKISDSIFLIAAQRVSTIMNSNKIIVLNDGEIVGMGTHIELLKKCEVYKEIVYSQLSKQEIDKQLKEGDC